MEVKLGLPVRRGRKWLRRNNVNVVDELEAACKEDAAENAAPEAENFEDVNAVTKKKITRRKKKKIKKKEKQLYLVEELD